MLGRIPVPVVVSGIVGLAMLVPAAYASVTDADGIAQNFFYSALFTLLLGGFVGLAMGRRQAVSAQRALLWVLAALLVMPVVLAVPFALSVPDTGLFNAWWEMASSLTTTGATLYSADLLAPSLHLWRGIVGWLGGLLTLIAATAILAPLRLGGFELMGASASYGVTIDPARRLTRAARTVIPAYAGLTLTLWVILLLLGDDGMIALMRAMGTLSTSGISPTLGAPGAASGFAGEAAIAVFLILALSRRFWPGGSELRVSERLRDDPELRLAAGIIALVVLILFVRHFIWAIEAEEAQLRPHLPLGQNLTEALSITWAAGFTALSFLTTTGWGALDWQGVWAWSGLESPGLMLAGLAMMGGGVATTAGGVKLLRIYALARHGEAEMDRTIHPRIIAGGGAVTRRLRREGAYLAFIFFMLFAVTIAMIVLLVTLRRIEFETATVLAIAALTNTGQLASVIPLTPAFEATAGTASAPWQGWSGLPAATKLVMAFAMVIGRIETLAVLALMSPGFWRR